MSPAQLKKTLDLALQQHQAGRFQEAEVHYRQVLAAAPRHADALHLLGLALHSTNRAEQALESILKAVALLPNSAEYHNSLIAVYMALGKTDQAIAAGRRAVQLQPQLPEAWFNLGNAIAATRQYQPAMECYQRAVSLRPNYAQAFLGLGTALNESKRFAEAITAYQKAIALRPTLPDAHYNLGNAYRAIGNDDQAVLCYRQAIAINPNHLEAINNLACTLQQLGHLDQALQLLLQARAAHPNKARVHTNLGNVLAEANQWQAAIQCYDQALAIDADFSDARFNRSLAYLMGGDFDRGWPEYESRWLCEKFPSPLRYTQRPLWRGQPLDGKRILIHAEQGLGDTLQFVRYIPMVAQRGGQVILQVQTPLHRLLQNTPGASQVIAHDLTPDEFDLQCPLWSLPLAFGTTLSSIPAITPGLTIDPAQCLQWRQRLNSIRRESDRKIVGLVWSGNANFLHNHRRSTQLQKFAPLADAQGITFVSLQKGPAAAQATAPPPGLRLIDWTSELNDFADTAALISLLDLVVTTDTGVAHLAALMGKPTWILLMYSPDFRWLLDREDCPWYPSATLFRQPAPGDWESPIRRIAELI
jgi:tetratricopeptide (TPR) repeat protein